MCEWQRVHFISELENNHNIYFETFNPLLYRSADEANLKLLSKLKQGHYDLFLSNSCNENLLYKDTLCEIKKSGIPSLCLRCDNLVIPYNDKVLSPLFDLVWLTSKETQHLYKKWKANAVFAPYAANPFVFQYSPYTPFVRRVCFIGSPYGSRSKMINNLTTNNIQVDAYCKRHNTDSHLPGIIPFYKDRQPSRIRILADRLRFKEGRLLLMGALVNKASFNKKIIFNKNINLLQSVVPLDLHKYYSRYALSLASTSANHTDVLDNPLKIINLRNFEIPMSGGIEICRFNSELADYFEDKKEIVFYRSKEELVDLSNYYLSKATEDEIRLIKEAARKRSENEHTWFCRFKIFFDILGLKY